MYVVIVDVDLIEDINTVSAYEKYGHPEKVKLPPAEPEAYQLNKA